MIDNLEDYNYFVDQGGLWQDHSRLEENITHIVRKGIFMQDDENTVEDIVLTLCGMFHYTDNNILGEFDIDWYNSWVETGACEKCFNIVNKREFQKWLVSEEANEVLEKLEKKEESDE